MKVIEYLNETCHDTYCDKFQSILTSFYVP